MLLAPPEVDCDDPFFFLGSEEKSCEQISRRNCPPALPETNIAPGNGWLEDDPFLLGCLFSGTMLVSGSVIKGFFARGVL